MPPGSFRVLKIPFIKTNVNVEHWQKESGKETQSANIFFEKI